jgi:hypothetical protein
MNQELTKSVEKESQPNLGFSGRTLWFLTVLQLSLALLFACGQRAWAVSPPVISPGTGIYFPGPTVTISGPAGATTYYTLDNSIPNVNSPVYSAGFAVGSSTTVNAIAVASGVSSSVATAQIVVDPTIQPVSNFTATYPPILWLRSDVGVTSSSGQVSAWADVSGQGNNATQSSGGNQPSLIQNDWNGYAGIATGTNQYFNLPSDFASLPNPWFFYVTKPTGSSNGVLMDLGNGSSTNNVTASAAGSTATFTDVTSGGTYSISAPSALTQGQYQVLEMSNLSGRTNNH